jgi:hypothetical protein
LLTDWPGRNPPETPLLCVLPGIGGRRRVSPFG